MSAQTHLQEHLVDPFDVICNMAEDESADSRCDPNAHEQNLFVGVRTKTLLYMLHLGQPMTNVFASVSQKWQEITEKEVSF